MTFGLVQRVEPFGNPGGYEKPAGRKKRFDRSIPSSTTAILMPAPSAPLVACSTSAPITDGDRSRAGVYARVG
jgi:hypothetical protein